MRLGIVLKGIRWAFYLHVHVVQIVYHTYSLQYRHDMVNETESYRH